ncbi:uncharacterized protein TNCV_3455201 [Trichonephila clavipes]|nr:uncharacterized protein TNCV_3455201 [Trichonephila clavipes]
MTIDISIKIPEICPTALHAIALETINTRFPPEEWLHIYTDGSLLDFAQGAGIGVFSHPFSFYLHAGPLTTHFEGEVEAIHIALQQIAVRLPPIERAVILSDSTSALQALSNYNENNCLRVQNCRELLGKIKGKIVFQWYHPTVVFGLLVLLVISLGVHYVRNPLGIPSSRAAVVAKFRLLTGHDCLCAHLFRFNLVTSPICVLCDTGQDMTAAHLDECSALNDLNCIVKRAMITNFFIPELNNHDVQELWFQQDGATCHTACATIDLLKDTFGDRLISRFGPVNWPPRSCDLSPLDYFLWGYVKSMRISHKCLTIWKTTFAVLLPIYGHKCWKKSSKIGRPDWTTSEPAVAVLCQKS